MEKGKKMPNSRIKVRTALCINSFDYNITVGFLYPIVEDRIKTILTIDDNNSFKEIPASHFRFTQ